MGGCGTSAELLLRVIQLLLSEDIISQKEEWEAYLPPSLL